MAGFQCSVCGTAFTVTPKVLAKYPGWKPRYCHEHSPKRRAATARARPGSDGIEENLTLAEVLARHEGGPTSGVFTDGSAKPNPGQGGWGVVWVEDGEVVDQRHGHVAKTTNNRMELTALIEAYRMLPDDTEVVVATDSRLCVDTITKWAPGWERKGWKKKDGEIKNLELVQELLALHRLHPRCKLEWIKAHSGNRWNEYADSLSTAWMRDEL